MKRRTLIPLLGLWLLCLATPPLYAQQQGAAPQGEGQTGNGQAPARPKLSYSAEVAKAESALGWARVYHDSYKRSKEYRYLKLAGDQGLRAIEVLYHTQLSLDRTQRFYYQVRKKRIYLCTYYQMLKEDSLGFGSRRILPEPTSSRCQF